MTDSTKTEPVAEVRQTKPGPLSGLTCAFGRHNSLRVVLAGRDPVGMECTGCYRTWTVTPVESPDPAEER